MLKHIIKGIQESNPINIVQISLGGPCHSYKATTMGMNVVTTYIVIDTTM